MSGERSALVAKHGHDPKRLVPLLRDLMEVEGYLSPKTLTEVARMLGIPRARVEGVAGFYAFLSTEPQGRFRVLFSDNITDEMAGSKALEQRMLDSFRIRPGEVSRDGMVSINTTSCTGLCDQGPAMLVNGRAIPRLTPARMGAITSLIRSGSPVSEWPENLFRIETHILRKDILLDTALRPGEALRSAFAQGADRTLEEIKSSNLRGRGGAGFTTGLKWEACKKAPSDERFVVCNADEGEPGTFKDRVLLSDYADRVIEGMTIAGWVVGARTGLLYLRGEYGFLEAPLEAKIAERTKAGLLGHGILGTFDFHLELRMGAGAYVCGEESALIESLEGKRGIPRNRPPYPTTHGYLQKPTVVNNVETFAAAAWIAQNGASAFRAIGTPKSAGTKIHSVCGDVARPGVYEYPFGVSVRQILEDAGAQNPQAVQVGGPSGRLLAPSELNRKIAFEDVPSAGSLMVFDQSRDILEVIDNFARFFAHESCGFCTPCRVGTTLIRKMTGQIVSGQGTRRDVKDLARIATLMTKASHCGLGATAGNPILQSLEKFKPAYNGRLASLEVLPSFDLDEALAPAREATGREDPEAHLSEVES